MAQKDVEIKIKAKDEASKGVKKISEALKIIATDASAAADAAKKSGGALGSLAADLAKLQDAGSKLQAFGAISKEFDKVSASVKEAEKGVKDASGSFGRLATEQSKNALRLSKLVQAQEQEKTALAASKAALADKNKEVAKNNTLVREAEKALDAYNKKLTVKKISNRNVDVFTVPTADQAQQRAQLESNARAAKVAQNDSITGAAKYRAEIERSTAALAGLKPQVTSTKAVQRSLTAETDKAASALGKQREKLNTVSSELNQIKGIAATAGAQMGNLASSQDAVADASGRMASKITAAKSQLDALRNAKVDKVVKIDSEDPATRTAAVKATFEANKAYRAAQEEVRNLAKEMRAAQTPTNQLAEAFGRAQAKVKLASQAYREQQSELRGVSAAARSGFKQWSQAADGKGAASTAPVDAANAAAADRASQAQTRLAAAIGRAGTATVGATSAGNGYRATLLGINSDTRQSLGLMQRLRGQILSLTAGYLGFQSALQGIKGSVGAFRDLEAAQSRLGAVYNQDQGRVAQEITWLRAESDRLGISFSVLAGQYTKFAVAAKQANFSAANTRRMFLSVAEAGRVNKLSMDQLNGTFLAIEQIISKGKFTSEEVRRQLGDRLPGAFNILAKAMGKSTAELDKVMSKGELFATESNLMKFTQEMSKEFGPQLSASLDTLTTDMGRFENTIFKTKLAIAEGFIPALREAIQAFNDFGSSAKGTELFTKIGDGVGKLVKILAVLPEYFELIVAGVKTLISLKVAGWALGFVNGLNLTKNSMMGFISTIPLALNASGQLTLAQRTVGVAFARVITAIDASRVSLALAANSSVVAGAKFAVLGRVLTVVRGVAMAAANTFRALWVAIGGLPGLVLTGIAYALTTWISGTDSATTAMAEHQRQVNAVKEAYELTGGKVKEWAKDIKNVNETLATANLTKLQAEYKSAFAKTIGGYKKLGNEIQRVYQEEYEAAQKNRRLMNMGMKPVPDKRSASARAYDADIKAISALNKQFELLKISSEDYLKRLNAIALASGSAEIKEMAGELGLLVTEATESGGALYDLSDAIRVAERIVGIFTGKYKDMGDVIEQATGQIAGGTEVLDPFGAALDKLKELVPSLAKELKTLKQETELNTAAWTAFMAAMGSGNLKGALQALSLWVQGRMDISNEIAGDPDARAKYGVKYTTEMNTLQGKYMEKMVTEAAKVAHSLGVTTRDILAVISFESNFRTSVKGGDGKKYLGLIQFSPANQKLYGIDSNSSIEEQMAAVDKYLRATGVKPGHGLAQIYAAILAGDASKVNASDVNNGGIVRNVTEAVTGSQFKPHLAKADALLDTYGYVEKDEDERRKAAKDAEDERRKAADEAAKERAKQQEATANRISDTNFEISQQKLINAEKGRQAAIEAAIRQAKAENPNITEAELAQIAAQTGALYDQKNVVDQRALAEEKVNMLMGHRASLMEQLKLAEEGGDEAGVSRIKTELEGINEQLRQAIDNAIAMHQALGGPEADAAIAKLNAQKMTIKESGDGIVMMGLNASQFQSLVGSFADGLVNALDGFVKTVMEGGNAFKALGTAFLQFAADFLRQIALMIIKQMILNALAGFGGPIGVAAKGLGGLAGHTGGLVGSVAIGGGNRLGKPSWTHAAFAYHSGGVAGLAPDEVSATLKKGEEILTEEDPRHRFNLGGEREGTKAPNIKQVLAIGDDEVANAMNGSAGEKVIMTIIQRNRSTLRKELG